MLHTIVPMDQIFPTDPQSGSPDRRSGGPDGQPGATERHGSNSGAFCGVGLGAEAAQGGAMARLDYRTATGKAFPC